jgi:hypothetical protein
MNHDVIGVVGRGLRLFRISHMQISVEKFVEKLVHFRGFHRAVFSYRDYKSGQSHTMVAGAKREEEGGNTHTHTSLDHLPFALC